MAGEFWLDDRQWAAIEPLLPTHQSGAHRKDDRRIISGIIHVLKVGCRWQDCPPRRPAHFETARFDRSSASPAERRRAQLPLRDRTGTVPP